MSKIWDSVKGVLGAVAPAIGTAVGGPMGGIAAQAISKALGLSNATDEEIAAAISGATPEQLLALKKADQEFAIEIKRLDIDIEKISADDRNSARQREATVRDRMPAILASGITIGFFSVLIFMLTNEMPEKGRDVLLVMLGSLGTSWTTIIAYYFGSSAGSRMKDLTELEKAKK